MRKILAWSHFEICIKCSQSTRHKYTQIFQKALSEKICQKQFCFKKGLFST